MSKHTAFKPSDTAILLVDHQPGVLAMVKSVPAGAVTSNAALLARLGDQLSISLVITSTREKLEFLGTTLKEIQAAPASTKVSCAQRLIVPVKTPNVHAPSTISATILRRHIRLPNLIAHYDV